MGVLDRFRLDGRVALVTGGNRGLGREMAQALAEAGADVALTSQEASRAEQAAAAIAGATGRRVRGYACQVTDAAQVTDTVARVVQDLGRLDILVNNAGINLRGPIEELDPADFRRVMEVNVTGAWLMCRAAGPHLKASGRGRVINVGSILSVVALPERTPYASSKGALLQLTRALALEWASHGITVNAILPGPFATEMNRALLEDPEAYARFVAQIPLGRWGELEEIRGVVVFLASDAASFITGAGIAIDGGWTDRGGGSAGPPPHPYPPPPPYPPKYSKD